MKLWHMRGHELTGSAERHALLTDLADNLHEMREHELLDLIRKMVEMIDDLEVDVADWMAIARAKE